MGSQQDLQILLRLLTAKKIPVMTAMGHIKALQTVKLRSIQDIADADLGSLEKVLKEKKVAKALQKSCKDHIANPDKPVIGSKRRGGAYAVLSPASKRQKQSSMYSPPITPDSDPVGYEATLSLPIISTPSRKIIDKIAATTLTTNRAPLVLAFALVLLSFTMPSQPMSSRLSLSQAVVSANSRSKAVSLGLEKGGPGAEDDGWAEGQPSVRVMGRDVKVLKRGGYLERLRDEERGGEEEEVKGEKGAQEETGRGEQSRPQVKVQIPLGDDTSSLESQPSKPPNQGQKPSPPPPPPPRWTASRSLSLKSSTFVARIIRLPASSTTSAHHLISTLLSTHPNLQTASHNSWALRRNARLESHTSTQVQESSFDDGERGAGQFLLSLLRTAHATDVLVVISRWFGGAFLGPDRWRLMRACVDDVLAEGMRLPPSSPLTSNTDHPANHIAFSDALWALDLDAMRLRSQSRTQTLVGNADGMGGMSGEGINSVLGKHHLPISHIGGGGGVGGNDGVLGAMIIHRPEPARKYLLWAFSASNSTTTTLTTTTDDTISTPNQRRTTTTTTSSPSSKRKEPDEEEEEEEEEKEDQSPLSLLLTSLHILMSSWSPHLSPQDLDSKAWSWYCAVRPDVSSGPSGWGAKGTLKLADILRLQRPSGEEGTGEVHGL